MKQNIQTHQDLQGLTTQTLDYYNQRAEDFFAGTVDHDVEQNITALLAHIDANEGVAPFTVLDVGCGPGRDLKAFSERGYVAVGLEGAERFAEMARDYSGCDVWQQNFLELDLPLSHFDGVFANASLFHVPRLALPNVLLALHTTLKPNGVLFSSNPRGNNTEGLSGSRYGAYYDLDTWRDYMVTAGFVELMHYYRPSGVPRDQQPWLASVWRKV
ncbi:SAM-dependent methyltransferase [hydrothermal vent metagenome]|uniref:SAM-dependent methyltransferase n=1 Tax=hydrothermal vent metagenome TaxID=652676 RepID=A0A3B0ZD10_9ZZZZ